MQICDILGPDTVGLNDMLLEREARAEIQRCLLSRGLDGLICLSMNMAGPVKDFPLLRIAFSQGQRCTQEALTHAGIGWTLLHTRTTKCGPCAFYSVDGPLVAVKKLLCHIEDTSSIGRLFDLDVLGPDGVKLSRTELDLPERSCLICDRLATDCGRSRRHTVEALQYASVTRILDYFSNHYADHVCTCAMHALLYEVSVTPKPGLVDRNNCGAHQDMDFYTFLNSSVSLLPWFRKFSLLGFEQGEKADEALFHSARALGTEAEHSMFLATGGVNTHKGLIFSIGLLCVAAGQLYRDRLLSGQMEYPSYSELCSRAGALAACALQDFDSDSADASHGTQVFRTHHVGGVRQEAADGFPSVIQWVLPILQCNDDLSLEEKGQKALLTLFCHVEDTNVLYRGGKAALSHLSKEAGKLLSKSRTVLQTELLLLDQDLIQKNISPGGCADLLAVGYFLNSIGGDRRSLFDTHQELT